MTQNKIPAPPSLQVLPLSSFIGSMFCPLIFIQKMKLPSWTELKLEGIWRNSEAIHSNQSSEMAPVCPPANSQHNKQNMTVSPTLPYKQIFH